jgi:hypothetical protein
MTTDSTPSLTVEGIGKNLVNIVSYLSPDSRMLELSQSRSLGSAEATSLLADARSATLYLPAPLAKSLQISTYMRDAGLLYIENVEKAVDVMTSLNLPLESRSDLSQEQFKLVKALEDRIEIHMEGEADTEFYEHGLQRLSNLGGRDESTSGLSVALADFSRSTGNPDDKTRADDCFRIAKTTIVSYIRCDTEIRAIIKSGTYDPNELIEVCKLSEAEPCDTSGIGGH